MKKKFVVTIGSLKGGKGQKGRGEVLMKGGTVCRGIVVCTV